MEYLSGRQSVREVFKALRVTDKVYWVGAIDSAVRDFHGYLTRRGTTYNAFLVLGEKVALLDTVKAGFGDELLARIASVIEPRRIDYVISHHAEPDHSGCLADVVAAVKPEKVFASKNGAAALREHYDIGAEITPVADGESLSLGDLDLTFAETRMCHWPDSMVSYLHTDKLLFSQDGFGMHLATCDLFDDECDPAIMDVEAARYYANILLPLSNFITKMLRKVTDLGIEPEIIAPDHGPIWRTDPGKIVADYARWAAQKRTDKAVVVYDTMWKSTDLMARALGEGLSAGGARVKLMPMSSSHRSDVAAEILDAGALLVGAPTLNNQMFPTVADVLTYLKGLKPKGLVGASFGSFGWSGEAPKKIRAMLEEMKVEIIDEPLRSRYVPGAESLQQCYDLGVKVAERVKQNTST